MARNTKTTKPAAKATTSKATKTRATKTRATKTRDTSATTTAPKKPHRCRPGTVALREIKKYQKDGNLLIPRGPFARLVREIIVNGHTKGLRMSKDALLALQESTEAFMVGFFELTNELAIHRTKQTIQAKDLLLARRILGRQPLSLTGPGGHAI